MSSATKTTNYGLNQWATNEYPKRQDFVDDNAKIDAALKTNADAISNVVGGSTKVATATTAAGYTADGAIAAAIASKATASTSVSTTLAAASWVGTASPYTQTLTVTGLTATQNGTISVAQSATAVQRATALKAKLSVTGQAVGSLTIIADGTLPTVGIPVTVILEG